MLLCVCWGDAPPGRHGADIQKIVTGKDNSHGPNNNKDTKPYMSSLLALLVLDRVYRLEIQSVKLVLI